MTLTNCTLVDAANVVPEDNQIGSFKIEELAAVA
jgi:hypothetical protein